MWWSSFDWNLPPSLGASVRVDRPNRCAQVGQQQQFGRTSGLRPSRPRRASDAACLCSVAVFSSERWKSLEPPLILFQLVPLISEVLSINGVFRYLILNLRVPACNSHNENDARWVKVFQRAETCTKLQPGWTSGLFGQRRGEKLFYLNFSNKEFLCSGRLQPSASSMISLQGRGQDCGNAAESFCHISVGLLLDRRWDVSASAQCLYIETFINMDLYMSQSINLFSGFLSHTSKSLIII